LVLERIANDDTATNYYIGNDEAGDSAFNGSIDEVMIFNRTLSQSEILALYNSQANLFNTTFKNLSLGQHNYTVYAVDQPGNRTNSGQRNFIASNVTSGIPITFLSPTPGNGSTTISNVTILANISDINTTANTSSWMDFDRTLLGYWSMDYYNATGIYDNSTWNNFATFSGGINSSNITTGIRGKGITFNGVDSYIGAGNTSSLNGIGCYILFLYG